MSLKQYQAFVNICANGSVSKAAKEMGMTQSSVTQLLLALEKKLGFKLMNRSKGGIKLTDEGAAVYDAICQVVRADTQVHKIAEDVRVYGINTIKIAAFKSVAVNWMPTIIKAFQNAYPYAEFVLFDGCYADIEEHIRNKDVDVGFVSMPANVDCPCFEIRRDELLAVLPAHHALINQDSVAASRFGQEPVVSLIDSTDRDARAYLEKNNVQPDIRYKTADDYAMLSMVENELGICIVHELVMQNDNHKVVLKKLDPAAFRIIGLAVPDFANAKKITKAFVAFMQQWAEKNYIK